MELLPRVLGERPRSMQELMDLTSGIPSATRHKLRFVLRKLGAVEGDRALWSLASNKPLA